MRAIARDELKNYQRPGRGKRVGGWLFFAGIFAVILVLAINTIATEREAAWEDEIFAVSTGWSMARSQPPILSVLAQYPQTGSPIRFYGPVSFETENLLIRIFGLSCLLWRFACMAGVALSIWASWGLVNAAGGDRWAGLITALLIALSGSLAPFPGRWDAVTSGLFLTGLVLFLRGAEYDGGPSIWRSAAAGVFIGLALASSPRALPLAVAALIATFLVTLCFRRISKRFLLGSLSMFSVAVLIQTLLLLPWRETSISWYLYLRKATRADRINATPLVGQGSWDPDFHHHKTLAILLIFLIFVFTYGAITQWAARVYTTKLPAKVFLTFFAVSNLVLMLLLLANALADSPFWLPPLVAAFTCWVNWHFPQNRQLGSIAVSAIAACLLLLALQEAKQVAAVTLSWDQRSLDNLKAFVMTTVPKGAAVYGPIGRYFYPVELSGDQYLYTHEQTTPGLYSHSPTPVGEKLDAEICAHPTYAIWSTPGPIYQSEGETMPEALRERLDKRVGVFHQPPLALWKKRVLDRIGEIDGKYGFADVAIYSLRSVKACSTR